MKNPTTSSFFPLVGLCAMAVSSASGAIMYATQGSSYTQDFDSLASTGTPAWNNDSTVAGWYWWSSDIDSGTPVTAGTPTTYIASSTLSATQYQILSLGRTSTTGSQASYTSTIGDRALGGQTNTGNTITYGMQLTNTTGSTLTSFSLSYTAEQWRTIANESADNLIVEYAIFTPNATNRLATSSATGWTSIASLQFTTSNFVTTSTGIDGNANNQMLSGTASGLTWADGQELWIRWRDGPNTRQSAMGVDDISFSAVPEPSAAMLCVIGSLALLRRRRA